MIIIGSIFVKFLSLSYAQFVPKRQRQQSKFCRKAKTIATTLKILHRICIYNYILIEVQMRFKINTKFDDLDQDLIDHF